MHTISSQFIGSHRCAPVKRDWFAIVVIVFEIAILLTAAAGAYAAIYYYY